MASTKNDRLTGATPFYTMNLVNSAMFSILPGIYVVASLLYGLVFGAPKINLVKTAQEASSNPRRTAVITGSNAGIGFATARQLVLHHNVDVILACRSRDRAIQAAERINAEAQVTPGVLSRAVFLHPCDLSSLASVRQFATALKEKYDTLDILICNAGVNSSVVEGNRTVDDLELIFQCNVLGHFLLIQLLLDLFPKESGRIVTLSSVAHHLVPSTASFDESYWRQLAEGSAGAIPVPYLGALIEDSVQTYPPSKLAALLLAVELNRRFYDSGDDKNTRQIRAFAVNPGAVASNIWRSFPWIAQMVMQRIFLSTDQGCATTVAAAVGEHDKDVLYLQPYWLPGSSNNKAPFPVFEMMGPFVGYNVTQPRLPLDGGVFAAKSLWNVCEEKIIGCTKE
ncbi:Short-chain dehydrogenase TIC 32, chloroplastic [Seminavis robusta]|uniref:Short-chain dehydrogenase TIC 32, chloroplastic n=1 Tax=Seminavis robusta TaxID=568900 RepID=A0A9N8ER79_9STRA|nr:Short-chain dehydrogenase TIC 32, chloroplastic [Seminavis robusta]|eukprot:Sro1486_g276600.1 Short-chain dehydrogenase TIC 32, chloroplastic (397) ;mRNA; r:675-1865